MPEPSKASQNISELLSGLMEVPPENIAISFSPSETITIVTIRSPELVDQNDEGRTCIRLALRTALSNAMMNAMPQNANITIEALPPVRHPEKPIILYQFHAEDNRNLCPYLDTMDIEEARKTLVEYYTRGTGGISRNITGGKIEEIKPPPRRR